jgi:hypothetical protein
VLDKFPETETFQLRCIPQFRSTNWITWPVLQTTLGTLGLSLSLPSPLFCFVCRLLSSLILHYSFFFFQFPVFVSRFFYSSLCLFSISIVLIACLFLVSSIALCLFFHFYSSNCLLVSRFLYSSLCLFSISIVLIACLFLVSSIALFVYFPFL